ncbi:FecR domain-containing protein [Massilia forsythiae]|uniref:FecR domain-containing protein n=1 Tax=Massilia forsythiae TaxID=2728020 RepID=A0A7Z2ZUL1_9BURK|nr:FecR family protein [Massilia forsythiae]QJE01167.1 FecR domain-containing protein [Massilia forsythiae]
MTKQRPRTIAIDAAAPARAARFARALLCAGALLAGSAAWAAPVGVVAHLSGPLLDRKPDGSVKVLGPKSEVESGDTLVSEKNTYAQIRFVDNSEITLRPGTTFRIEHFSYDAAKPEGDSAAFGLVKGGLRSITGLLGKRNKEKFMLKTPGATIGIRGTTFIAQWIEAPAGTPSAVPAGAALPAESAPGLHVSVSDGAIMVSNGAGALGFLAGQAGYVPSATVAPVPAPPAAAPAFVPPASFGANQPMGAQGQGAAPQQGAGADCVVR